MLAFLGLLGFLAVTLLVGGVSGISTASSVTTWYAGLAKPSWNPPGWVFGPVWTLLYILMAVAAWLVWRERGVRPVRGALALYAVQLVLNGLWSPLFFGLRSPGAALAEIVPLWGSVLATLITFRRIRPAAGALFVPYLLWVTFATALNFAVWQMNR